MKSTQHHIIVAAIAVAILTGCGGQAQKGRGFFTSGSREADQRAEQRMASVQQVRKTEGNEKDQKGEAVKSLYERLGGEEGVTRIVDDFVDRVIADPRVNWERKNVKRGGISLRRGQSVEWKPNPESIKQMKKHIVQFISVSTSGPAKYEGKGMKEVHTGMHITNSEFEAAVGDLKATLDRLKVADKEQQELVAVIETTRTQVVEER